MSTATYLRVGFVLAAAVTMAAACSAFSDAEEETTPAPTPDASPEASQTDATTTIDATVDAGDAGDAAATCTTFEDDFASGAGRWMPYNMACLKAEIAFVSRDAGDNAVELACDAPVAEAFQVLQRGTFAVVAKTRISWSFKIGLTTSHVFAQLLDLFGGSGANLSLVATPSEIQLWRRGVSLITSWPAGDQTRWRSMVIELEPKDPLGATLAAKATLDGEVRPFDVPRDLDGGTSELTLQIGPFANVDIGDFRDSYDDIRISSCP